MQISPKEDEVKALQKYSGPLNELSPPEQFLLVMSSVPRLSDKIHLLMLMHQFEVPSPAPILHVVVVSFGKALCCWMLLHRPATNFKMNSSAGHLHHLHDISSAHEIQFINGEEHQIQA